MPPEGTNSQNAMPDPLPCLILTGASGIVGRSFLPAAQEKLRIYAIVAYLQSPVRNDRFPDYAGMSWKKLRWFIGVVYDLLTAAVRTGDRELLLHYIHDFEAIIEKLNAFYRPTDTIIPDQNAAADAVKGSTE